MSLGCGYGFGHCTVLYVLCTHALLCVVCVFALCPLSQPDGSLTFSTVPWCRLNHS